MYLYEWYMCIDIHHVHVHVHVDGGVSAVTFSTGTGGTLAGERQ